MLGPNSLLLREKLGVVSGLQIVCHCPENRVYGKSVSQNFLPISMWVFSLFTQCAGVAQLVS